MAIRQSSMNSQGSPNVVMRVAKGVACFVAGAATFVVGGAVSVAAGAAIAYVGWKLGGDVGHWVSPTQTGERVGNIAGELVGFGEGAIAAAVFGCIGSAALAGYVGKSLAD